MNTRFYDFLRPLARVFYFLFWGVRARGVENLPAGGGVVVCSNHAHARDPFVLASCVRRRLHFMAKAELFQNRLEGRFITAIGAFPVRRGERDLGAVREALKVLADGHALGIFPQGTRSHENARTRMEPGVAMIALRAGVPVVPAYIDGPYRLFRRTRVILGAPVPLEDFDRHCDRATLEKAAERIEEAVWALRPGAGEKVGSR